METWQQEQGGQPQPNSSLSPQPPLKNVWDHSLYIMQPVEVVLSHSTFQFFPSGPSFPASGVSLTLAVCRGGEVTSNPPTSPAPELTVSTV